MMKAYELVMGTTIVALQALSDWFWSERGLYFMLGLDVGLLLLAAFMWGCVL